MDRRPLCLGLLAADLVPYQGPFIYLWREVSANINGVVMIRRHLLHPIGDTAGLHIGYLWSINIHSMFSGTLRRPLAKDVRARRGGRWGYFIPPCDSAMVWLTLAMGPDGELDLGFRHFFYSLGFSRRVRQ